MIRISSALVGAMLATTELAGAARAEPPTERAFATTTLNLSAQGESEAAPDKAVITLGVQIKAATAGEAMRQDAIRMAQVIAALKKAGLADRDIQTSNLSLGAQYDYVQNQPPRLNGYQASNEVTVTVNDLARLGPAVDASVAAGADQINGISFGLKNSHAAEDAARKAAVVALQAKAELYAAATGYHVQRLVNLSEGGGYQPSPIRPMAMMRTADAATPIAPGQLTVRVDISGIYELAK